MKGWGLLLLYALFSLVLAVATFVSPDDAYVNVCITAAVYIVVTIARFSAGSVDLLDLREWSLFGFAIWMYVGVIKYEYGIDRSDIAILPATHGLTCACILLGGGFHTLGLILAPAVPCPPFLAARPSRPLLAVMSFVMIPLALYYELEWSNLLGGVQLIPSPVAGAAIVALPIATCLAYAASLKSPGWAYRLAVFAGVVAALQDGSRKVFGTVLFGLAGLLIHSRARSGTRLSRSWLVFFFLVLLAAFYVTASVIRSATFSERRWDYFSADLESSMSTARNLSTFDECARCFEYYPRHVGLLHGSSYVAAVLNLFPRLLWKEKPVSFSKELAVRRVLTFGDYSYSREMELDIGYSSYSGTTVGEAWANFGYPGVIIVLFVLGCLVALCQQWVRRAREDSWIVALYGVMMFAVLIQHRGCSSSANAFLIPALYFAAADWIFLGRRRPETAPSTASTAS